jgi:mono/diheme cytochrome c family protein
MIAFRRAHRPLVPKQSQATAGGTADAAKLFSQTCASCHTLAAAHAKGTVRPNLDQLRPSKSVVVRQVTNGGGGMPAFGDRLSRRRSLRSRRTSRSRPGEK